MEFETATPSAITDEQRQRASLRQATLVPLNPFMKPEDAPDPLVVIETHANLDLDSEITGRESTAMIRPSQSAQTNAWATPPTSRTTTQQKHHGRIFFLLIGSLVAGALGGAAYFVFIG